MNQGTWRRTRFLALTCLVLGALVYVLGNTALARQASEFQIGDVFVSMQNGSVEWHEEDGTLRAVLVSQAGGHAEGMAFDSPMNLYVTHMSSANHPNGTTEKWNTSGVVQGTFGSGYACNPRSIVFDEAGNALVGQMDCERDILKFNAAGTLVASFNAATEARGTDWIDLAANGCTVVYTSQGVNVKRFDICTNTQLSNFNTAPLPFDPLAGSAANQVKILPDGGVIVANVTEIVRLDAAGNQVQTYDVAGSPQGWLGLDVGVDGVSFWAGNHANNTVYKFNLSTGAVISSFQTGGPPKSVIVKKPPREVQGRMTGGGSVFEGTLRVTHGFQLRCDADDPRQNLEVNWGGGNQFHLLDVTSASCTDDPTYAEPPPVAGFDTYRATGTGRYNRVDGATAEWTFTDQGEPGKQDRIVNLTIRDANGALVLQVTNRNLTFGNHQAHRQ